MDLTQNFLKSLFEYDPLTGIVTWKEGRSNMIKGSRVGCKNGSGYLIVTINSKSYRLHRIIWLYMFSQIPRNFHIDHINGNKTDNRICNLRLVTTKQNQENRPAPKNNSSGYRGVTWHKSYKKWMSRISHHNKRITLGFYDTAEEAYEEYKKAAKKLYTHTDRLLS